MDQQENKEFQTPELPTLLAQYDKEHRRLSIILDQEENQNIFQDYTLSKELIEVAKGIIEVFSQIQEINLAQENDIVENIYREISFNPIEKSLLSQMYF